MKERKEQKGHHKFIPKQCLLHYEMEEGLDAETVSKIKPHLKPLKDPVSGNKTCFCIEPKDAPGSNIIGRYWHYSILDKMPTGWVKDRIDGGAPGTIRVNNGKSPILRQYKIALLRVKKIDSLYE